MNELQTQTYNEAFIDELQKISGVKNRELVEKIAKAKLGSGARFKALEKKIARRGDVRDPGAVAAAIGRKKYGSKRFAALSKAGK